MGSDNNIAIIIMQRQLGEAAQFLRQATVILESIGEQTLADQGRDLALAIEQTALLTGGAPSETR